MTAPVIRLHLFFATENDTALILRQGPSRFFRLILWDRATDTFEDGQWLKHKVYVDVCDISPDGRHFLYFALNGDWSGPTKGAYSAISRAPYFTALAMHPVGDTWGGGGVFLDSEHYWAYGDKDAIGRADGVRRVRSTSRTPANPLGLETEAGRIPRLNDGHKRQLVGCLGSGKIDQFSRRHRDRHPAHDLYDTQGGILSRRHGLDLDPIRDFTDMEFQPIRAPYDWREGQTEWHPLDRDR